jgi:iron complex transport system ATP-binding protein
MMIELSGVSVTRAGRTLLHPLDLAVETGSWLCVVGPNGAGKTTLLRSLAGTVRHSGTIRFAGQDASRLHPRERARLVAFVPQHPTIPPGTSVWDYALLGRTPHIPALSTERAVDRRVVAGVLDRLGMTELRDRDLASLSGGERQRAVIARALAQEAPILVLDEPTTGLDIGHQQQVLALVDELRHERELTVVSAMHDLTLAGQHASSFMLLAHGGVAARGTAAEVFDAELLGEVFAAAVNVIEDNGDLVVIPVRH